MHKLIILLISFSFIIGCSDPSTSVKEKNEDTDTNIQDTNIPDTVIVLTAPVIDEKTLQATAPADNLVECLDMEIPLSICHENNLAAATGSVTFDNGKCNFAVELVTCPTEGCVIKENTDSKCWDACEELTGCSIITEPIYFIATNLYISVLGTDQCYIDEDEYLDAHCGLEFDEYKKNDEGIYIHKITRPIPLDALEHLLISEEELAELNINYKE